MESLEISAKTVEEAVELALKELGASSREEVEVVVLSDGKSGFLGFGGGEAKVRVIKCQPEDVKQAALATSREMIERILSLMGVSASVQEKEPPEDGRALVGLELLGDDLGILIGRRGNTLASLQYLVYLMVGHELKAHVPISIDVEGYRERRQEALRSLAVRMAQRVLDVGLPVTMEPMPAAERRIIHLALRDHPQVTTMSEGEGDDRKITILKEATG